jgi:PAS domain S-box-containing protein
MLSKLYEEAMNKSNIVIRVDKNKKITYVNDLFCKLMGYTKIELIGSDYSCIKRPDDIKDEDIEKIWEEVEKENMWKGELRNISKKGKMYHFISMVVPIRNAKGEILEYMGIRQDISEVVELHEELEATQREIVYKMGEIGETRSKETGNHVKRVAEYSKLLAELYGLSSKEADILFTASPMHDIGKVGIPDAILNKPGSLDDKEWKIMKTHSAIGYNILKNSKREVLKAAAVVAREHHEKWDGSGYPRKLKGEKIHIFGRITAIADVFDALGSDRCYKKAWEDEKIFKLLEEEKGKHFDPSLVELFMINVEEFKRIRDKYKD